MDYTADLAETITITEALSAGVAATVPLAETVTVTEALTAVKAATVPLSETVTTTGAVGDPVEGTTPRTDTVIQQSVGGEFTGGVEVGRAVADIGDLHLEAKRLGGAPNGGRTVVTLGAAVLTCRYDAVRDTVYVAGPSGTTVGQVVVAINRVNAPWRAVTANAAALVVAGNVQLTGGQDAERPASSFYTLLETDGDGGRFFPDTDAPTALMGFVATLEAAVDWTLYVAPRAGTPRFAVASGNGTDVAVMGLVRLQAGHGVYFVAASSGKARVTFDTGVRTRGQLRS